MNEEELNRKKPIHCEWYRKPWYKDSNTWGDDGFIQGMSSFYNNTFDKKKFSAYKAKKDLINALSKQKYGIILENNHIHVKKVIGGKMVDGTKSKVKTIIVDLNKIKSNDITNQVKYIENLFNID